MKSAFVAVRPNVEFQGFQFHTVLIGYIFQVQGGKIGLTGLRTQTGELRHVNPYGEVPSRLGIVEGFKIFGRLSSGHGDKIVGK